MLSNRWPQPDANAHQGAAYNFGGTSCNDTIVPALTPDDYRVAAFILLPWPRNSGACLEAALFDRALTYCK